MSLTCTSVSPFRCGVRLLCGLTPIAVRQPESWAKLPPASRVSFWAIGLRLVRRGKRCDIEASPPQKRMSQSTCGSMLERRNKVCKELQSMDGWMLGWMDGWIGVSTHIYIYIYICRYTYNIYTYRIHSELEYTYRIHSEPE